MFVLFGDSALSAFRVQRLVDTCQKSNFDVRGLRTSYIYLLDAKPANAMISRLAKLLSATEEAPFAADIICWGFCTIE